MSAEEAVFVLGKWISPVLPRLVAREAEAGRDVTILSVGYPQNKRQSRAVAKALEAVAGLQVRFDAILVLGAAELAAELSSADGPRFLGAPWERRRLASMATRVV